MAGVIASFAKRKSILLALASVLALHVVSLSLPPHLLAFAPSSIQSIFGPKMNLGFWDEFCTSQLGLKFCSFVNSFVRKLRGIV